MHTRITNTLTIVIPWSPTYTTHRLVFPLTHSQAGLHVRRGPRGPPDQKRRALQPSSNQPDSQTVLCGRTEKTLGDRLCRCSSLMHNAHLQQVIATPRNTV